jgi:hypothetical protein
MARPILAVAFALALASTSPGTQAQALAQADGFVAVGDLPQRPSSARVVLFSLPDAFDACLPLHGACPQDSSSLLVVPALGRSIVWQPEGAELPRVELPGGSLAAVGTPPAGATSARYLVPVVDGRGAGLVFVERAVAGGRFDVPDQEGPADAAPYVPVLSGPSLVGTAPTNAEPERLLAEPVVVDEGELTADPVAVLVVRRAPPSRVAFGVRPDPSWRMQTDVVPLLGEGGLAGLVRHEGRVRLAVAAPDDVDPDAVRRGTPRRGGGTAGSDRPVDGEDGEDDGDSSGGAVAALVPAAAVLGGVTAFVLRRRARRATR